MLRIRPATIKDVRLLHTMILEFAEFEKLLEHVHATEETLLRDGFGEKPLFRALMAEWDGSVAGYVICYVFYSSFEGPGLFLEDIYVRDRFRGHGIGRALMAEVAALALQEGFWGVRWEVLNWNEPAIDFYRRLDATFLDDWKEVRIEGDALRRLAAGAKFTEQLSKKK